MWKRLAGLFVGCIATLGGASGQTSTSEAAPVARVEPAPFGAWTVEGGNPSRSRASATPAPRRRPERAWTWTSRGRLVGEPLVWRDFVVVEERLADERRTVTVLDRLTGAPRGSPITLRAERPLAPSLWGTDLVVRADDSTLHGYALRTRGPYRTWRRTLDAPLGRPLLVGEVVYVAAAGRLLALDYGRRSVRWEADGGFVGPLSVRDGQVCALQERRELGGGYLRVARLDAGSGEALTWRQFVGVDDGLGDLDAAQVIPLEGGELLWFEGGASAGDRRSRSLALFGMDREETGSFEFRFPHLTTPPALLGGGFIARSALDGPDDATWARMLDRTRGIDLAGGFLHADVAARGGPPAATADLVYLGGLAVDPESLRVEWGLPSRGTFVPVVDGVLVAREDGSALEAWLVPPAASRGAIDPLAAASEGWSGEDAVAVLTNGEALGGDLALEPGLGLVRRRGRRADDWPLDQVALVVGPEGGLVWAAGATAAIESMGTLIDGARAEEVERIAKRAARTRDPELLGALLSVGSQLGLDESLLEDLSVELERLERTPGRARPGAGASSLVELDATAALELDGRWAWIEVLEEVDGLERDRRLELQLGLLRELLERAPEDPRALEWVVGRLPEDVAVGRTRSTAEWIDYLDALRRLPVALVAPPGPGRDQVSDDERRLARARLGWREDLLGVASPELLVITPLARPGTVAWMLTRGELLCRTLDGWFEGYEPRRRERRTLEVRLYESAAEYARQSAREGGHGGLGWTAGHFDPNDAVTRFFLPDPDARELSDALSTFQHELAHHWLDRRCPAFAASDLARDPSAPGFWIVEGFASMVEDLVLDVDADRALPGGRLGWKVATLAALPSEALLPWESLFALEQRQLGALGGRGETSVAVARQLGHRQRVDSMGIFYAQAAATARYLFEAEGGRYREALLDHTVAFYTGDRAGLDLARTVGLEPAELGARVHAWAREQVAAELSVR